MPNPNTPTDPNLHLPAALWLVSRERRPLDARESWTSGAPATLKVGLHFDVVHLPSSVVERGIDGITDRDAIRHHFRTAGLTSAVIVSRSQTRYSVLVPPGASRDWAEPGIPCIGIESPINYVGVPVPTRREPPGSYWLMPAPDDECMLCDPANIRLLIGKARARQGRTR
ncbi:hypothetical protein [Streptomyces morookaense]|uniref:DNA primase/polymerase bifunctional N-terminal domain-containing protein n=1 Tax=Streptomyces morookaense TaxID=1970 RepID=A0A7Y7E6C0_STRMO|nr:hypothetical protein [Streptomyces morookaense]NVK77700.1 hypothetical protein [Streptomyces morookaense]